MHAPRFTRTLGALVLAAGLALAADATPAAAAACASYSSYGNTEFGWSKITHSSVAMWVTKYGSISEGSSHDHVQVGDSKLIMQSDGNLVLYNQCGTAVWSSNTYHKPSTSMPYTQMAVQFGHWLISFPDHDIRTPDVNEDWYLAVQADGNLVLYKNISSFGVVWASNTNQ